MKDRIELSCTCTLVFSDTLPHLILFQPCYNYLKKQKHKMEIEGTISDINHLLDRLDEIR